MVDFHGAKFAGFCAAVAKLKVIAGVAIAHVNLHVGPIFFLHALSTIHCSLTDFVFTKDRKGSTMVELATGWVLRQVPQPIV